MSDKHIDAQLQAIQQELLSAPLLDTAEINSFEPVHILRRKRSLLTKFRRQYDRLDDRYQWPVRILGSLAVFFRSVFQAWKPNPQPKPRARSGGGGGISVVTNAIRTSTESTEAAPQVRVSSGTRHGWDKYTPE